MKLSNLKTLGHISIIPGYIFQSSSSQSIIFWSFHLLHIHHSAFLNPTEPQVRTEGRANPKGVDMKRILAGVIAN